MFFVSCLTQIHLRGDLSSNICMYANEFYVQDPSTSATIKKTTNSRKRSSWHIPSFPGYRQRLSVHDIHGVPSIVLYCSVLIYVCVTTHYQNHFKPANHEARPSGARSLSGEKIICPLLYVKQLLANGFFLETYGNLQHRLISVTMIPFA